MKNFKKGDIVKIVNNPNDFGYMKEYIGKTCKLIEENGISPDGIKLWYCDLEYIPNLNRMLSIGENCIELVSLDLVKFMQVFNAKYNKVICNRFILDLVKFDTNITPSKSTILLNILKVHCKNSLDEAKLNLNGFCNWLNSLDTENKQIVNKFLNTLI